MPTATSEVAGQRILRWPWSSLWGDLVRGGAGALVAVFVALMNSPGSMWQLCLLGLAAVFGTLAVLALRKRATRVVLTDLGLEVHAPPMKPQALQWSALDMLELRYYGARSRTRGPVGGFMELALRSGQTRIILDDGIDGFRDMLKYAVAAARTRELGLNAITETNLAHLLEHK